MRRRGYTVIEILIVISILGVLLSVVVLIGMHRAKKLKSDIRDSHEQSTQGEELSPDRFRLNQEILGLQKEMDARLLRGLEEKRTPAVFRIGMGVRYDPQEKDIVAMVRQLLASALLRARANQPRETLALLREASLLSPMDPGIATQAARVALFANETEYAREQVQTALRLDPEFAEGYLVLATIQIQENQHDQALETLKTAAGLKQKGPEIFLIYARYYERTNQMEKAQEALVQYRSLGGTSHP